MRSLSFLLFVALTFISWGLYGPVLHIGQESMIGEGEHHLGKGSLRPFICVGVAYFLIAVLFPIFALTAKKEDGNWTMSGFFWSFVAGAVGAIGALGIVLAFKFKGSPVYVMPLVFGCAPVVNTVVTMLMSKTLKNASLLFYVGVAVVAIGAAGVLTFKPTIKKSEMPATHETSETQGGENTSAESDKGSDSNSDAKQNPEPNADQDQIGQTSQDSTASPDSDAATDQDSKNAQETTEKAPAANPDQESDSQTPEASPKTGPNLLYVFLCILVTALCWGSYGPVLHKGQAKMGNSRLRPFLCVGLAYFAIAVIGPYFLLPYFEEPGWKIVGSFWSLMAGVAGAVGALGIIYAFNFGGKPIFVMPLVFGFAPVVNTFTEITKNGLFGQISQMFYASLALVILGAVTVLVCAPRGKKPQPKDEEKDDSDSDGDDSDNDD